MCGAFSLGKYANSGSHGSKLKAVKQLNQHITHLSSQTHGMCFAPQDATAFQQWANFRLRHVHFPFLLFITRVAAVVSRVCFPKFADQQLELPRASLDMLQEGPEDQLMGLARHPSSRPEHGRKGKHLEVK